MKNFMGILRNEKNDSDGGAGGKKETPQVESKDTPAPEAQGDVTDDLGYGVQTPEPEAKEDVKPEQKEKPAEKLEELKDASTGYGAKPLKEEAVEEKPEVKEEPKVELGYELEVKDIDPAEATKIKEFAKANALTKEVAQALLDMKKSELSAAAQAQAEAVANSKKQVAALKASWDKELREDPVFGGDKFDRNVMKAEKVLAEHMGATKKELTERKSMLPPYVMRDLAKVHDILYGTENLKNGDAGTGEIEEDKKIDDPLDFYK